MKLVSISEAKAVESNVCILNECTKGNQYSFFLFLWLVGSESCLLA